MKQIKLKHYLKKCDKDDSVRIFLNGQPVTTVCLPHELKNDSEYNFFKNTKVVEVIEIKSSFANTVKNIHVTDI